MEDEHIFEDEYIVFVDDIPDDMKLPLGELARSGITNRVDIVGDRTEDKYILLVEDNPDDVKLTLRVFAKSGITNRVQLASDGVEALEYLHGTGKFAGHDPNALPAIILLDLKMPRLSGIEVLQRIRADEQTKRVPVVILTTSNEETDRLDCYALGANSYIRKPAKFSQFTEVVEQLNVYLADA